MKVLYVSKALVVAAYRDKLRHLGPYVDVTGVIPKDWGRSGIEEGNEKDIRLRRLPAILHGHNHFHVYRGLSRVLGEERPNLLHIDEEPYSAVTFQAVRLARREGIPAVFFGAQTIYKRLPPPFNSIRRYVYRNAAGGTAGTRTAAEVLRRGGYEGKLEVIPQFGVDPNRFRPDLRAKKRIRTRLGIEPESVLVGFGGRLVCEKGVGLLVGALARLGEETHLVFLGEGPEEAQLRAQAVETGVGDRVHFPGQVSSTDMPAWLPGLDILALPSLTTRGWAEQFGRIAVEAMACGVPVVGSDSGEIPRVVGDAGVVVPEGEVDALAGALEGLVSQPEERRRLGERGRARLLQRYTQERVVVATVSFYRGVVDGVG